MTASSGESDTEILPFDDSVEPLALPEEIAEYNEAVATRGYARGSFEWSCRYYFLVSLFSLLLRPNIKY